MYNTPIPSRYWEQELRDKNLIDFRPTPSDSGHIIVSRNLPDEGKETIGHVYVEVDGDDYIYTCTNRKGREIFPPTTDFNLVEMKFERYARLLALQQKARQNQKQFQNKNNLTLKNQNTMKTQQQNPQQKKQKENQFRFIEYERATGDGHFLTIADSYHNVIGRVHKIFNDETKKYEYVAFDHAGNIFSKSDRLWEVKKEFINNREQLLEQAHQRRIVSKEQTKEVSKEKPQSKQITKAEERKSEIENLRGEKTGRGKQNEKVIEEAGTKASESVEEKIDSRVNAEGNNHSDEESNQQQEREEELEDLRDSQDDDRGDMER
ncbi:MAG TPA: hypothetical protein VI757_12790 [Bacteroidia bacterium]|nr:hypothetical protein [Bacteroidia bacterium]